MISIDPTAKERTQVGRIHIDGRGPWSRLLGGLEGGRRKSTEVNDGEREMVRKKRQWSDGRRARRMKKEGKRGGNKGDGWTEVWKEGY